jgi:hypothetical protein
MNKALPDKDKQAFLGVKEDITYVKQHDTSYARDVMCRIQNVVANGFDWSNNFLNCCNTCRLEGRCFYYIDIVERLV